MCLHIFQNYGTVSQTVGALYYYYSQSNSYHVCRMWNKKKSRLLVFETNPGPRTAAPLVGDAASMNSALALHVVIPGHIPGPPDQLHRTVELDVFVVNDIFRPEEQYGRPNHKQRNQCNPVTLCQSHDYLCSSLLAR